MCFFFYVFKWNFLFLIAYVKKKKIVSRDVSQILFLGKLNCICIPLANIEQEGAEIYKSLLIYLNKYNYKIKNLFTKNVASFTGPTHRIMVIFYTMI